MSPNECAVCSKPGLWCNACKKVAYCSKEHQKEHWRKHKKECKIERERRVKEESKNENSTVVLMDDLIVKRDPQLNGDQDLKPKSMPKWVDTNSVKINVSHDCNLTKNDEKMTNEVINNMKKYGLSAWDNFLNEEGLADKVLQNVLQLYQTKERFKDGQTVLKMEASPENQKIRGDLVTWLNATEDEYPAIHRLCNRMDTVVAKCQKELGNYRIVERTKAMIACYPGNGTGYKCHVDNPTKDGRCITVIYYLNKTWSTNDGGLLRIYPTALTPRTADIQPRFNRLLLFYSDKRNPHEVLPSYANRFAITCWYFDQEERNNALKTWAKDLKRL